MIGSRFYKQVHMAASTRRMPWRTARGVCLLYCRFLAAVLASFLAAEGSAAAAESAAPAALLSTDFESDPWKAGWTPFGAGIYGENLLWSEDRPHSGKRCLEIVPKPGATSGGWESPPFAVKEGRWYRVSFFARSAKPAFWQILFYDRNGALVEGDHNASIDPSDDWTGREFFFRTKFPGQTATIVFYTTGGARLGIDDVTIRDAEKKEVLAAADQLWAAMPPCAAAPPADAGQFLPRTAAKLRRGGPLRIVLLGDSIANDLSNSCFALLLERAFPGAQIDYLFTGRAGTGWLKLQFQVEQRLTQHRPDLIVLLALSNSPQHLADPLERLVADVRRSLPETELLLVTPHVRGWFGSADIGARQTEETLRIARQEKIAVLDLLTAWETYAKANREDAPGLLRDGLHMHERGRQLSARLLVAAIAAGTARPAAVSGGPLPAPRPTDSGGSPLSPQSPEEVRPVHSVKALR